MLKDDAHLRVELLDPTGFPSMLRMNQLFPPFDNPDIRRALLGAVDQSDFMSAVAGTDASAWKGDLGYFPPGSPLASNAGMQALEGKRDIAAVRKKIIDAGYKGERVVVLVASDYPVLNAMGLVGVDMLQRCGFNVNVVETDWGSVVQRRANRGAPDHGG